MGRRTGSIHSICRRVGERLCTTDKCPVARRSYPPGVHGPKQKRPRFTSYGLQLREKQKAKAIYGLMERQFKKYFEEAKRRRGDTAEFLLRILETRLDNVIFRLGLAKTRAQARQSVSHGHVLVDGKPVNIPSFQVRPGEVISLRETSRKNPYFSAVLPALAKHEPPSWLLFDAEEGGGKVLSFPSGGDLKQNFDPKLIIEFYSR